MEVIDTFYVLDYDRCLGNVDASFSQLKKIVHELSIINEDLFQLARDTAESKGISFSALGYIKNFDNSIDIGNIERLFIEYSADKPNRLLENGAIDLLDYLASVGMNYCIVSYGESRWQSLKIKASGLSYIPNIIIPNSYKGRYISKWKDNNDGLFKIPKRCFFDGISRYAKEIVLVDDKLIAFEGISNGIRGYLVNPLMSKSDKSKDVPYNVKIVTKIYQIINEELQRKSAQLI